VDRCKLLLVEVVLERERLEIVLLEDAALLRLVEQGLDRCFKQGRAQFVSHPSIVGVCGTPRGFPRIHLNALAAAGIPPQS
jgi:hypothetical protein